MTIGIDGPAGSGKTTVAKLLAKKLGISYLDSGATYRSLTLKALNSGTDLTNKNSLKKLANDMDLKFVQEKVYLDGVDVTTKIRTPMIDKNISSIVGYPEVREVMVDLQRKIAVKGDFVIEGRDITTVVFPNSKYKFYLDADSKIRIQRRFKELKDKGLDVALKETEEDLIKRDEADKTRKISPLKISKDAIYIDTTKLSIEETVEVIAKCIDLKK